MTKSSAQPKACKQKKNRYRLRSWARDQDNFHIHHHLQVMMPMKNKGKVCSDFGAEIERTAKQILIIFLYKKTITFHVGICYYSFIWRMMMIWSYRYCYNTKLAGYANLSYVFAVNDSIIKISKKTMEQEKKVF